MRVAVISDIHANELALDAVRIHADKHKVDQFWCLGDIIGYGPDPIASLMFTKQNIEADNWVMGNHEAMLADLILPQDDVLQIQRKDHSVEINTNAGTRRVRGIFLSIEEWEATNAHPIQAIELNRKDLDEDANASQFWRSAFTVEQMEPVHKNLDGCEYTLIHASQENFIGRYLYSWQHEILLPTEFENLQNQFQDQMCPQIQLFGHTHVPTLVHANLTENGIFNLEPIYISLAQPNELGDKLTLINPGSVGQPRDLDRRAAYAILDTEAHTVTFWRLEYDYQETARRLSGKKYPKRLARHLVSAVPDNKTPEIWRLHYEKSAKEKL
jgi:predicted phosphodiesterase